MNTEQSNVTAFPLAWPAGWKRTTGRVRAKFSRKEEKKYRRIDGSTYSRSETSKLTIADSRDRLQDELRKLGAVSVVISSNLRLRSDGQPASGQAEPADPGVCVYFRLNGQPRCLPCDKWERAADNLAAIAKFVEAMRGQIRWGVGSVDAAFAGFKALPGGNGPIVTPAAMTLEQAARFVVDQSGKGYTNPADVTQGVIRMVSLFQGVYRAAALRLHPDAGGCAADWATLSAAAGILKGHHNIA